MTPEQCREARRLLRWTQARLATAGGVSQSYVSWFEVNGALPTAAPSGRDRLADARAALEQAGIVFIEGQEPGVKLRKAEPRPLPNAAEPDTCSGGRWSVSER